MSPLPAAYAWIDRVIASGEAPRTLIEARKRFGVAEVPGAPDNPEILAWARELGVEADYVRDEVSWCGLFMGVVVERAGWRPVERLLAARSWLRFGQPADRPSLGDILVFWRGSKTGWQGHVGLYVGEDATAFHVLGGNQGDRVSIARIAKSRLLGARRPKWRVAQPKGVKPVRLLAAGKLLETEA